MKYELLAINIPNKENDTRNVALIKRGNARKEYAVVRNLDVHRSMENDDCWDNTIEYYEDSIYGIQKAIECYRVKTEENYISRSRLEELATNFKDYALEQLDECELDATRDMIERYDISDYEAEFFGMEIENEDEEPCESDYYLGKQYPFDDLYNGLNEE